ncbi:hypothetical protein [Halioxenophilus sp. WMMB6]|uniref:hypothetical protein n=1 Tax=Halioxenophilus sp. WMMB6 TaxID=3073815 RepID=UPI00295E682F|nr:hypothetical protein [Halioxenophilus sp. WMMB6]
MMAIRNYPLTLLLAGLVLHPLASQAGVGHTGWFIGGTVGYGEADFSADLGSYVVGTPTTIIDFSGDRVSSVVAVGEASYVGRADTELYFIGTGSELKETESSTLFGPYFGYNFTRWFGLEGQIAVGQYGDFEVAYVAFLPRFTLSVAPRVDLFAHLGPQVIAMVDQDDDDNSGGGVLDMIGIGITYAITDHLKASLSADYASGELEFDKHSDYGRFDLKVDQTAFGATLFYQF